MYVRVCVCACAGSECEPECMRVCVCNVYVCIWIGCWQNGDGTFSEGVSVVYVFVSVCASSFFVTQLLSLNYSQRLTRHTQIHRHTSVQKRADKVPANVSGSGFVGRYWNDTRTCNFCWIYTHTNKKHTYMMKMLPNVFVWITFYHTNKNKKLYTLTTKPICSFKGQVTRTAADPVIVFVYRVFF